MALQRSEKKFIGRVLVVDDNWITLKLIEKMLQSFSLSPVIVDSGAEALKLFRNEAFDVIFLDCTMPEIDGYSVAKEIRAHEMSMSRPKSVKIVAFTGDDSIENRRLCKEAGMDGLFPKPYSYTSLEELLSKILATAPA